ncbi:MAG TPA: hypothetical protein VJ180_00220, partial [Pyrinomonadaceae bacterium]|nr:hypothetical protein [Pyrinomonadaceae bacterium]
VERRPEDRELVVMMVEACLEAEDAKGAERAASVLIGQDISDYTYLVAVAKLYLKLGEIEETVRVLTGIVEQMLAGREEKELLEIVNEVLTRNPDHVGALRLLVRVHWWQRDMDALRGALERMAEAAQAGELVDDERYALTQLVRLLPDEQKFLDRLNQLGGIHEDAAEENLLPVDSFAEASKFETFQTEGTETFGISADQKDQFDWQVVTAGTQGDASASFAELNETTVTFDEFETHRAEEQKIGVIGGPPSGTPTETGEDSKRDTMMRQELESVDFYLSQGYIDIAADTLEMLVRQFGPHPEIQSRRNRLQDSSIKPSAGEPEIFEFGGADELVTGKEVIATEIESSFDVVLEPAAGVPAAKEPRVPASKPAGPGIDAGLAEIFEEFRLAAEEEQIGEKEDFETHYNMGTAYKEMDLLDDAIHEFQTAANLVRSGDGTSRFLKCCTMLGHCFVQKGMPRAAVMWFQKGLDARGHEEEQKALRYELASVFELMGDFEQAHDLFSEVYGVDVGYREVGDKLRDLETKKNRRIRKRRKTDE